MNVKKFILMVVKIVGVASAAALLNKYERKNTDETTATAAGRLGQSVSMWAIGFAVATAGGIAALATLPGLLTVLGAVSLTIITLGLWLGAGAEAKERAQERLPGVQVEWRRDRGHNHAEKKTAIELAEDAAADD